jgi:fibronectin type 3 domain-containing protein
MFLKSKKYFTLLLLPIMFGCDRVISNNSNESGLPPAVPVNLQVFFAQDGTIGFEWKNNVEINLTGYNIYRSINDTLNFINIYFTDQNYFYDDSLSYDTTYYYCITALDDQNRESNKSVIISARPINYSPPSAPVNLSVNARNWIDSISIYLKWDPNFESDIAGYQIFRNENQNFNMDSTNLIGFAGTNSYSDKKNLELYKNYYYRINAIDKGGMVSDPSQEVTDLILDIPRVYYPPDKSIVTYFDNFKIGSLAVPAAYQIVVQTNEYFGEIWNNEINSSVINDTIYIPFNINSINTDVPYYWRVITYSNSSDPNSISPLYSFTIKQ